MGRKGNQKSILFPLLQKRQLFNFITKGVWFVVVVVVFSPDRTQN